MFFKATGKRVFLLVYLGNSYCAWELINTPSLFNLVFSLLPAALRGVVGFLGFKHDRKLALKALAVSANQNDVHAVFSG